MNRHDAALAKVRAGLRGLRAERAALLANTEPTAVDLTDEHRAAIDRIDAAVDSIDGALGIVDRITGGDR